ncbi:MAG: polysaccharide deacetylase family protein [Nitrospiraceae bacterium]|nr:polysaccharide deacetylase family protein [Nitrospiraceae bacterium]
MRNLNQKLKAVMRLGAAGLSYAAQMHRWRHRGKVIILMYHRVLSTENLCEESIQAGMYVRDVVFRRQMEFVRSHFTVVPLGELVRLWQCSQLDTKATYCAVTFDDGWQDNYLHAYPVLKELGVPATVFLPTDFVGTARWFWPDLLARVIGAVSDKSNSGEAESQMRAVLDEYFGGQPITLPDGPIGKSGFADQLIEHCKTIPPERTQQLIESLACSFDVPLPTNRVIVNWEEVREMSQFGLTFGSHSCSHRIMTSLPNDQVVQELSHSRRVLLESGASYTPIFCYPNGNSNETVQRLARECGYEAAVGVGPGIGGDRPANWFNIPRVGIHDDISYTIPLFAFRMFGPLPAAA